ncbi:MAG: OmpA family protein [Limnobacter sp.]|uniref:flagellar motor protein MotB n=1 Tax=Limnobacter sp. TaxID=2003368 RepID=UPI0022BE86C5|nr:flagellar motor protein MotB [Limnobacter sp.]MCZ8016127.1 OmpA family protein [Limnobacter sp.]
MSLMTSYSTPHRSDEGEKPFWISYADLMTALMILFLVIMVAALAAISRQAQELVEKAQKGDVEKPVVIVRTKEPEITQTDLRFQEINEICDSLSKSAERVNPNLNVDCKLNRINFGSQGQFNTDEYKLGAAGENALADVVPVILETANTPLGQKWLKQVVIEGYTDTDGSYLYNLNLSLKRSEWVMCTLLRSDGLGPIQFTSDQRIQIKKLFLAGGVAFNNIQSSKDASRRIELRLQFYGQESEKPISPAYELKFQDNSRERCML